MIIYEQGKASGRDAGAESVSKLGGEFVVDNLAMVTKLYQALGWFRLEEVEFDRENGTILIRTSDNFECAGTASKVPVSQFVRGHLAGSSSTYLGREVSCEETSCIARGDKNCVFALKPK